jgi:hypothetical protein
MNSRLTRLCAAKRQPAGSRERGAAALESVATYVVAGVLASGLVLTAISTSPGVHDKFRQALCMLTTLGEGPCVSSVSAAQSHIPTVPCVVTAKGHNGAVEATVVVTVGTSEQYLVEKLNNGTSRVTRGTGGKAGIGTSVGANLTATWGKKTYGAAASAGLDVAAEFSAGEVYYAHTKEEIAQLMSAHRQDVANDNVFGDSGPVRGAVNSLESFIGLKNDLPQPDETYSQGGVTANADAQSTFLMANAQAGVGAQAVLGTRQGADGTSTTYYKATLDANISAGTWAADAKTDQNAYSQASLDGMAQGVFEVERDSNHNITAVRVKSVLAGAAEASQQGGTVDNGPGAKQSFTENVTELPINTPTDQAIAQRYLNAAGMGPMGGFKDLPKGAQSYLPIANPLDAWGATKAFARAATTRGVVTTQSFDDTKSSEYALTFDAEFLAKAGGAVKVETVDRTSTGAKYWSGTDWAIWKGCGVK